MVAITHELDSVNDEHRWTYFRDDLERAQIAVEDVVNLLEIIDVETVGANSHIHSARDRSLRCAYGRLRDLSRYLNRLQQP